MKEVEYCDPFDKKKYDYWMKLEHAGRYVFAKDFISNHKNFDVADISCATGYGTEFLSDVCKHIDGYDFSADYLKKAKKRKLKNGNFYQIDFNKEILKDKKYDCVVSFETIEHIENTQNFMQSLSNILKKDGYLILSFPNCKYEQLDEQGNIVYKFHKHIFKKQDIFDLLRQYNFELIDVYGQSLCNAIVSNFHVLRHERKVIYSAKLLNKYNYSKKSIIMNSYIYSYPDKVMIDESYSYTCICKKI